MRYLSNSKPALTPVPVWPRMTKTMDHPDSQEKPEKQMRTDRCPWPVKIGIPGQSGVGSNSAHVAASPSFGVASFGDDKAFFRKRFAGCSRNLKVRRLAAIIGTTQATKWLGPCWNLCKSFTK